MPSFDTGKASKSLLQNELCNWVRATYQGGRATRQGAFLNVILHVHYASEGRYALGKAHYALGFSPRNLPASNSNPFLTQTNYNILKKEKVKQQSIVRTVSIYISAILPSKLCQKPNQLMSRVMTVIQHQK